MNSYEVVVNRGQSRDSVAWALVAARTKCHTAHASYSCHHAVVKIEKNNPMKSHAVVVAFFHMILRDELILSFKRSPHFEKGNNL